jgi:adenosylcobinamide-GDP ribazoletransferase
LIRDFLAAVAFLTRLPVALHFVFGPQEVARSARWFPLVGALLGAFSVGGLYLFYPLFPPLIAAILLTGIDTLLTGAMHFDGLADTADGFGGGATRDDVLRIMRDHTIGSYGGVALVLVAALKIATIAALIDMNRAIMALMLAPVLGRWSAVLLSATQPYARSMPDGQPVSAGAPTRFVGRMELVFATVTALAIVLVMDPRRGSEAFLLTGLASAGWAWQCRRRIGGITGDTLGAGVELSECLVLLLFTAHF